VLINLYHWLLVKRCCVANRLTVGTSIRAPSKSSGAYSSRKIHAINEIGAYNITFDDGSTRENTPLNEMTLDVKSPNSLTNYCVWSR
jgi:hypothetical protein